MLPTVRAKPSSTKPMPSCAVRNGNSGGRTRLWKCWTKCAAETTTIARASRLRPLSFLLRVVSPAPWMAAASVVIGVLPPERAYAQNIGGIAQATSVGLAELICLRGDGDAYPHPDPPPVG